jgi:16S rRNA (adenine1518-N6/adenine1519-N6)-dimethyltransferase
VRAKKRLGQHFLEAAWVRKVVDAIAPQAGERFIEVGPGRGALTLGLAERAAEVVAVELDREAIAALEPRLPPNARVVPGDVLDVDLAAMARDLAARGPVRVAGNLPYYISSPILFRLLALGREAPVVDATIMLQKEVVDRVVAGPDTRDYGTLSVFCQLHADVRRVLSLPPGAFRPAPRVHSGVVQLRFRAPEVDVGDPDVFVRLVRAIFTQRRKTLTNALRPFAALRGQDEGAILDAAGLDGRRRPDTLSLGELADLARAAVQAPRRSPLVL